MFFQSWRTAFQPFGTASFGGLVLALLAAYLLYLLAVRWATSKRESADAAAPGCLVSLLGVLFQGVTVGCFVALATPLLSGAATGIAWEGAMPYLFAGIRAGVFAALVVTGLSLIPYLGKFLGGNPGVEFFLIAATVFRVCAPARGRFPDFWESLGYLAAAWLLCKLLQLAFHGARKAFSKSAKSPILGAVVGPTVDLLGGLAAFLAYAAHAKLS